MKLGIDISQLVYKGTGVGRFTEGLTQAILDNESTNQWTFFFSSLRQRLPPELVGKIYSKGHTLINWSVPPTLLSFLWNNLHASFTVPAQLNSLDWFITSDWTEPPLRSNKATIIHDLVFLRYPETVNSIIRDTQARRLQWVTKESKIIFTDSRSTKNDFLHYYTFDEFKVKTVYPGVVIKEPTSEEINTTIQKYGLHKKFILSVGKIEPRKNIPRLIKAFHELPDDVELVIVGLKGWEHIDTVHDPRVRFLGFVSDTELAALYKTALFFVFPSIWEGFGYPAVEAMKLGCPIALSNTSSLGELGNQVARFFGPEDEGSIKNTLQEMIRNDQLRTDVRLKGLEKSREFSWTNYYQTLINTLHDYRN